MAGFALRCDLMAAAAVAALMFAGAGVQPAHAQDAGANEARGDGDAIIVTARRRDENLQDVPLAISAIGGDALESRNIQTLEDIRTLTPSLQISASSSGPAVPGFTIRGQRQIEARVVQDPSVGVYFADVVQQRAHGTTLALYDLESVQVLRGPQGTLFGRNTTGGAILIAPKRPELGEFGGEVSLSAGDKKFISATGVANLAVGENFAVRAAGQIKHRDDYARNLVNGTGLNGFDTKSVRISALWEPVDALSSYTVATYVKHTDNGGASAITHVRPGSSVDQFFPANAELALQNARSPYVVKNSAQPFSDLENLLVSNTTSYEFSPGLTIKNIIGYRNLSYSNVQDFDGTQYVIFDTRFTTDSEQFSNELQLLGNALDNRLSYIVGGYYFWEKGDEEQLSRTFGARPSNRDYGVTNKSYSVFAQADFEIVPSLTFTGGLRQTWDKRQMNLRSRVSTFAGQPVNPVDLSYCRFNTSDTVLMPLTPCSRDTAASFNALTYLASLKYQVSQDLMVYAMHNNGYRSGGLQPFATRPEEEVPYLPEKAKNYEIGIKSQMLDGMLQLNVAAFYTDYRNIQRTQSRACEGSTALCTLVENAAKASVKGFEVETTVQPASWLKVGGFFGYTDASYDEFILGDGRDASGFSFAFVPKQTYGLNVEISVPVAIGGKVAILADYFHQAKMAGADVNSPYPLKSYDLVNGSVAWRDAMASGLDVSLWMRNITNERYANTNLDLYDSFGIIAASYSEPRTYGVSMTAKF